MDLESLKPSVLGDSSHQRRAARSEQKPPSPVSPDTISERLQQGLLTDSDRAAPDKTALPRPERFTLRSFARQLKDAAFRQFEISENEAIDKEELIVAGENLAASGVDSVRLDGFIDQFSEEPSAKAESDDSSSDSVSPEQRSKRFPQVESSSGEEDSE